MIEPASLDALLYVAHNMREWDRREIMATRWSDDPAALAVDCWAHKRTAWIVGREGRPIVACGAIERWPGVHSVWMFATPEIAAVRLSLHRFITRDIMPALRAGGARRADCMSMDGHTDAHAWLLALGARRHETPFLKFGRAGETFWQFSWEPE